MSDIFHKALVEDAARIKVSPKTWEQVKQSHGCKPKKTNWKRRLFTYGACAAILLIVAIGISGFVSPVMAKVLQKVPVIGELYWSLSQKLNQHATETDISATDKGITVSAEKVYYNGKQFNIIYAIQVPEEYIPTSQPQLQFFSLDKFTLDKEQPRLNGKPFTMDYSGLKMLGGNSTDSLVSPNMYRGYINYRLALDQVIPQKGTLTIPIHQVGAVKGNWSLSIPVSGVAINNATKTVFPQNASTTYDCMTLTVNEVSKGPVYTYISMQLRQTLGADGEPQSTTNLVELFGVPMEFAILDINHQYLNFADLNGQDYKKVGNEKIWDFTIRCNTPPSDVEAIIIEPILLVLYEEGVTEGNNPRIPELAVTVPIK